MDNDDDIEHLFSWLQTPELRYREFAGAREITDTAMTWQTPPNSGDAAAAPSENGQLEEEYPTAPLFDANGTSADTLIAAPPVTVSTSHEPITIAPTRTEAVDGAPPAHAGTNPAGSFGPKAPAPQNAVRPLLMQPQAAPPPSSAPNASSLLGGAYKEHGANGNDEPSGTEVRSAGANDSHRRNQRSLDAVFGRLAGGRDRLPDPRERLRHSQGLGLPTNRSR